MTESFDDDVSMEILLLSPFFWRPENIFNFIVEASRVQNDETKCNAGNWDSKMMSRLGNWKNVLQESTHCLKVGSDEPILNKYKWKDAVQGSFSHEKETTDFDILTHGYYSVRNSNPKVINASDKTSEYRENDPIAPLKIMRDKYAHFDNIPPMFQKALGWTTGVKKFDGKWEFDKNKFVKYWTDRLPSLLPFLWQSFYHVGQDKASLLNKFYENLNNNQSSGIKLPIDLEGLVNVLTESLQRDLEKGGVTGRFLADIESDLEDASQCDLNKCGTLPGIQAEQVVLEFRTQEEAAVQRILDCRSILKTELSCQSARCFWYNEYTTGCVAKDETRIRFVNAHKCNNKRVIIVGNKANSIIKLVADDLKTSSCVTHIIIFCGEDVVTEKHFDQLQQTSYCTRPIPIGWREIRSESVKNTVINEKILKIQNAVFSLDALLPTSDDDRAQLLSCLEGNLLNKILRDKTVYLFQDLKIPQVSEIYIPRKVFKKIVVSREILEKAPSSEIFVVSNATRKKIEKLFPRNAVSDILEDIYSFYFNATEGITMFVRDAMSSAKFKIICTEMKEIGLSDRNIHLVSFAKDDSFEWICTQGSTAFLIESGVSISGNSSIVDENEFLNTVRACWNSKKAVAIVDKSGNGKTSFLSKVATKSSEGLGNLFTFYFTMSELVEKVGFENANTQTVVEALSSMVSQSKFERKLCEYWLQCEDRSHFTCKKVEFFIDALDEVKIDQRKKAVTIFRHIHALPSVGLCFTLRDHFLVDLQKFSINTELYKLKPFSLGVQVKFLVEYWQSKQSENLIGSDLEKLTNFARECLNLRLAEQDVRIAGTPLICRILAEIYESYALSGDYGKPFECASLCNLYDLMWDRKLEIWLEKLEASLGKLIKDSPEVDAIRTEMQNWHTYLAVKLLFGEEFANKFQLCFFTSKQSVDKMHSTVLQQGVVTSIDPLIFIHQTFAEDMVARFVVDVFSGNYLNLNVDSEDFLQFLSNHVLAVPGPTIRSKCFEHPTLCYFLNARSQNQKSIFGTSLLPIVDGRWFLRQVPSKICNSILTAFYQRFVHLLVLLPKSRVYVIGFFECAIVFGKEGHCERLLEHGGTAMFDPESFSRYCKLNSLSDSSIEHWFFQTVCQYHFKSYTMVHLIKNLLPIMIKKYQFDLERTDSEGKTILLAVLSMPTLPSTPELAKILVVDFGAKVGAVDNFGNTVLHVAHKCTAFCVFECLVSVSEAADKYVLFWKSVFKTQLIRDAVNAKNDDGETPLLAAVKVFQGAALFTIQFFKEHGADFDVENKWGETVLDIAFTMKIDYLFDTLVRCGASVDGFEKSFEEISFLVQMNCPIVLEKLICKSGENFHNLKGEGDPLAHQIIRHFDNKLVIKLLESRVNMGVVDSNGTSAFHLAAMKNVELLVLCVESYKLDVNVKDSHGKTLLHKIRSAKLIPQIREYGADFNAKDDDGEAVLERAIRIADAALVDALVEGGADICRLRKSYDYVFSLALMGSVSALKEYVRFIGMDFDFKDEYDETRLELMKVCIEKRGANVKSNVNRAKRTYNRPLWWEMDDSLNCWSSWEQI